MYSLATNTSPSNREPTFSIVIAAINCSEFIAETINSITPQLKEKDEIIIVDDNSSDNSLEIYKKLASNEPRISFFINPSKGVASSRNFGNSKAKNNFILPLDSDDLLKKDTLKCYRHYIEKYKNFDVFYGNCEYFNQEKTISYVLRLPRILNRKLAVFWLLCFPRVGCKQIGRAHV
jgi:glycosyltransferase involved in cell wall biosynthesis